ncbi:uncharacterized protein L3040_006652 [Drepanopeziza brunnea f. sp. 'multigermtubi']|uniref:Uncharacterized protein n=1 Tax=Marssonina brunnea f. sp. multigermtubi (strain MB_m1) TaxID=1072389 RepID=K1WWS4_MARBU|nr:uncharacterized protein MBM_04397 [Drepanopeziza brunnea f. sp. 'multigermtubi' MB_m1]EKD17536.1 hypothetical protein MBM_04397 [Drepanopeziza brunnea f. sp. 'multigermtubi' MB_m1]KAJ5038979.1 hypothetical protein L3040_006652 [Drepanopeziza brunnea f. sp. 'multigermtubi']
MPEKESKPPGTKQTAGSQKFASSSRLHPPLLSNPKPSSSHHPAQDKNPGKIITQDGQVGDMTRTHMEGMVPMTGYEKTTIEGKGSCDPADKEPQSCERSTPVTVLKIGRATDEEERHNPGSFPKPLSKSKTQQLSRMPTVMGDRAGSAQTPQRLSSKADRSSKDPKSAEGDGSVKVKETPKGPSKSTPILQSKNHKDGEHPSKDHPISKGLQPPPVESLKPPKLPQSAKAPPNPKTHAPQSAATPVENVAPPSSPPAPKPISTAPPRIKSVLVSAADRKMASFQTKIATLPPPQRKTQETWAQSIIAQTSQCPQDFRWERRDDHAGYQCAGRNHFVSDELVAEGKGGVYFLPTESRSAPGSLSLRWGPYYPDRPQSGRYLWHGAEPKADRVLDGWVKSASGETRCFYDTKAGRVYGPPKTFIRPDRDLGGRTEAEEFRRMVAKDWEVERAAAWRGSKGVAAGAGVPYPGSIRGSGRLQPDRGPSASGLRPSAPKEVSKPASKLPSKLGEQCETKHH